MIVEPSKSYGKVGVIFKRKRSMIRSSNEANIQPSSNHSAKEKNDKSPRRPGKTRLIGWDNELCRPLYVYSPKTINREFSLQSPKDTTDDRNVTVLNEKIHVDKLKNNEGNLITKLKSIRSYSLRNKLKGSKLSATASAVLEEHCTSSESLGCKIDTEHVSVGLDTTTLTQPSTESSSDENDNSIRKLLCTPPPSKSRQSICSVLGSDVAKSPLHSNEFKYRTSSPNDALFVNDDDENYTHDPNRKKIVKLLHRGKPKSNRVRASKDELSKGSLSLDTNLLNTKAYFEQLDATSLTFDRKEADVFSDTRQATTTSRCVRSTRRLNLLDSSLLEHYESYKQASKDSGVTPIKLIDFAKDRSNYYLENGICEGLMEEE